jgi:hypothetical protein
MIHRLPLEIRSQRFTPFSSRYASNSMSMASAGRGSLYR